MTFSWTSLRITIDYILHLPHNADSICLVIKKLISQYISYITIMSFTQQYKQKMKSISTIHPTNMGNTEIHLCAPHIWIRESHNAIISAVSDSFHTIINEEKCLCHSCPALKPFRTYRKSSLTGSCEDRAGVQR